jgi:hypothetical protein
MIGPGAARESSSVIPAPRPAQVRREAAPTPTRSLPPSVCPRCHEAAFTYAGHETPAARDAGHRWDLWSCACGALCTVDVDAPGSPPGVWRPKPRRTRPKE